MPNKNKLPRLVAKMAGKTLMLKRGIGLLNSVFTWVRTLTFTKIHYLFDGQSKAAWCM